MKRKEQTIVEKEIPGREHAGYAYIYPLDGGARQEYVLEMTPENIANFIGAHQYDAEKIILTDMLDNLILDTAGGFIMNCPDQILCGRVLPCWPDPDGAAQGKRDPRSPAGRRLRRMLPRRTSLAHSSEVAHMEIRRGGHLLCGPDPCGRMRTGRPTPGAGHHKTMWATITVPRSSSLPLPAEEEEKRRGCPPISGCPGCPLGLRTASFAMLGTGADH